MNLRFDLDALFHAREELRQAEAVLKTADEHFSGFYDVPVLEMFGFLRNLVQTRHIAEQNLETKLFDRIDEIIAELPPQ